MITEQLMRPGRFDVRLVQNVPYRIWAAVDQLDHIVITPTRLADPKQFADASILSAAIYTGVITGKPTKKSFVGQGLAYWLGTEDGRGSIYETAKTFSNDTLSTVIASLLPSSITSGTITNAGTTNLYYVFRYITPREAIHFACRCMGAEWRINPAGTFDAAIASTLFVTNPTSVIVKNSGGRDGARAYNGIDANEINIAQDADGYTTKAIIVGQKGDGAEFTVGTASAGSVTKKDMFNNTVVFKRMVDAPDTPSTSIANLATNVLAQYPEKRQHLTLTSDTYAVPTVVKPGDYVNVFDQEAGLYDTTRQLRWRGEVISPVKLRCKEYTWPVQRGMGVYVRRSGATPTYTDITDYVDYEDRQDTSWVVGSGRNDPEQDPTLLGPAFLGKNADILSRITDPDWVAYTPTLTGCTVGTTATASYRLRGKKLEVQIDFNAGAAKSAAAGVVTISLPASLTTPTVNVQALHAMNATIIVSARITASSSAITVYGDNAGGNWAASAGLASLQINGLIKVL